MLANWRSVSPKQWAVNLILSGCVLGMPLIGGSAQAEDAAKLYEELFGTREAQVIKTRSLDDDLAFSKEIIEAMDLLEEDDALKVYSLDRAMKLAVKHPEGKEILSQGMEMLKELDPAKYKLWQDEYLEVLEHQYRRSNARVKREQSGEPYLNALMESAAQKEKDLELSEAADLLRDAARVAVVLGDREQAEALNEQSKALKTQARSLIRIKAIRKKIADGSVTDQEIHEITLFYLLELNRPEEANQYAQASKDTKLKTMMGQLIQTEPELDLKGFIALTEWLEAEIDAWKSDKGKAHGYVRALGLANQVLEKSEGKGVMSLKANVLAKRYSAALEKLGGEGKSLKVYSSLQPGWLWVQEKKGDRFSGVIYKALNSGWMHKTMPDQPINGKQGQLQVYGLLVVPKSGEYELVFSEYNYAVGRVKIGDQEIPAAEKAGKGENPSGFHPVKVKLSKGTHPVEMTVKISYAKMGAWWKIPGTEEIVPIPIEAMKHNKDMLKNLKIDPAKIPK